MKGENEQVAVGRRESEARTCVVGIGASAGGLEAIREMLSQANRRSDLAYVVIQHLDPNHESLLAELLARHTELEVLQAAGGERIESGKVFIIPPGHGLSVSGGILHLTDFAQPRGLRRPIDDFFESLAEDQGANAACVILSGTGADGSAGLRAIKEHGGLCIVQDPETAKYDGMPVSAQSTGLVDFVLEPQQIIASILQFYARSGSGDADHLVRTVEESVASVCNIIRKTVGHDFSGYKKSTLARRIQRRVQVLDMVDAAEYLQRLRSDPDECETLFREFLINVTRFFRDPEHFKALREEVVKPLVERTEQREIRVWIPGCSSGEEAYSIAMLFADEVRRQKRNVGIQIFATDIDEQMLRIAREGIYPHAALADVPEGMRDLYTIAREGTFQLTAQIRDMIRFSVHSIVRDPPFSGIDLLSCRNLLIYFGDRLQKSALPIFHYAIRPEGALFLGPSETVGRLDNLFAPIDEHSRIFRRLGGPTEYPIHLRGVERGGPRPLSHRGREPERDPTRVDWTASVSADRMLQSYAPASLHVNKSGQILSSTGRLGKYLELRPSGAESEYAQTVARPGLREAISALIRQVAASGKKSLTRNLSAHSEFGTQELDLVADPLGDDTILIVFRDRDRFQPHEDDDFEEVEPSDTHVQSLEDELRSTRARLHTTVEELETANEELKSSNEEMMSMNEELQSTNEELATVNDELKTKVEELSVANTDLTNLFTSTTLPLIVVDAEMRIRNYTDAITAIYPVRNSDRGRSLGEFTSAINENDEVLDSIVEVLRADEPRQRIVTERSSDRTWSLVISPYRTRRGALDGATLVFTELTEALRLQEELTRERERLQLALKVADLGVWEFDRKEEVFEFDGKGSDLLRLSEEHETLGLTTLLALTLPEEREAVTDAIRAGDTDDTVVDFTITLANGEEQRSLQWVGRHIGSGATARLLGVIFDVTKERETQRIRELMMREMNHRVKNMFSIITGMIRIAGRSSDSIPQLVEGIERRVAALAQSHDMTQRKASEGPVTIKHAVKTALAPYDGAAELDLDGPEVPIAASDLTAIALLLHEWATNTAKYGVLGPVDGRLRVSWEKHADEKVELTWNEIYAGQVTISDGDGPGFGSTLIQLSAVQIQGSVAVDQTESGRVTRLVYEHGE